MKPDTNNHFEQLQEDFEDLFENAVCGFVTTDAEGKIIRANNRIAGWLGRDAGSIKGQRFSDLLTIGGKIYYETHLWPLLRMQGFFDEVALELSCANKDKLQVLVNAIERRDEQDRPQFIRFTVLKATDRRRYEANLLEARSAAELSLSNALQVAELREQFIAILGHDLRNPLGAIVAAASLLKEADLPSPHDKAVAVLARSADRMSEMIKNIMDFAVSRLGGGMRINKQSVLLTPVLTQVIDELGAIFPGRAIKTEFDITEPVECDPDRVAQLLSNLLANALTHGDTSQPVIVRAFHKDGILELSVSNGGKPIPADHIERLFEPFTRENARPSQNGLGLGLYIASQISLAHAGTLAATSTAEETRFTFRVAQG